jgi:hypothetical protein
MAPPLSGASLGLAWSGAHQWSAKLEIAERVGNNPRLVHEPVRRNPNGETLMNYGPRVWQPDMAIAA